MLKNKIKKNITWLYNYITKWLNSCMVLLLKKNKKSKINKAIRFLIVKFQKSVFPFLKRAKRFFMIKLQKNIIPFLNKIKKQLKRIFTFKMFFKFSVSFCCLIMIFNLVFYLTIRESKVYQVESLSSNNQTTLKILKKYKDKDYQIKKEDNNLLITNKKTKKEKLVFNNLKNQKITDEIKIHFTKSKSKTIHYKTNNPDPKAGVKQVKTEGKFKIAFRKIIEKIKEIDFFSKVLAQNDSELQGINEIDKTVEVEEDLITEDIEETKEVKEIDEVVEEISFSAKTTEDKEEEIIEEDLIIKEDEKIEGSTVEEVEAGEETDNMGNIDKNEIIENNSKIKYIKIRDVEDLGLNVRSESNTDSEIVFYAQIGEVFEILEEYTQLDSKHQTGQGNWYKIEYDKDEYGWVFGEYVKKIELGDNLETEQGEDENTEEEVENENIETEEENENSENAEEDNEQEKNTDAEITEEELQDAQNNYKDENVEIETVENNEEDQNNEDKNVEEEIEDENIEIKEEDNKNSQTAIEEVQSLTEIVAIQALSENDQTLPLEFDSAQVTLKKIEAKPINVILTCPDWAYDMKENTCGVAWEIDRTVKIVSQNNKEVIFEVNHFSAYIGVYLEIVNIESNLTQGDKWIVKFNTYGQSDLIIQVIDGTEYPRDITLDGIYCGDKKLDQSEYNFIDQTITVSNYYCEQESRIQNQTITSGRHWLSFSFGDTQNAKAHNFACDSGTLDTTCYVTTEQAMANNDTISGIGNLIIQNGGSLTASAGDSFNINMGGDITLEATTTTAIAGNFNATSTNFIINENTSINLNFKGYSGGVGGVGSGPGGGAQYSFYSGGGGYGGDGGNGNNASAQGGSTYSSITQPTNLGSGGGGYSSSYYGGSGGGAVKLNVLDILTVNGLITANGGNYVGDYSAGGSGGSVWIDTGILTGAGTITANGGNGASTRGGGGAGGRIAINYTTDSSTITNSAYGASTGYQKGGAGTIFTKADSATNGDLIVDNGTVDGVDTCQTAGSNYIFDNITVKNYGKYVVPLGTSLTIADDFKTGTANASFTNNGTLSLSSDTIISMLSAFTNTGTFSLPATSTISSIASFTNSGTINTLADLTIATTTFYQNGILTDLTDLTIGSSTTFEFQNLSTTTSFTLTNLTIQDGGTLTHQANNTTQVDTLNLIVTNNLDIQTGGSINLDFKGYAGGASYSNGYGPGKGIYGAKYSGSGAGYGGNGGSDEQGDLGGFAYGSITQPTDLGSGGAGAYSGSTGYGYGGGSAKLNILGTLTLNGLITANGGNGQVAYNRDGGGGSGGSVWIIAGTLIGAGTINSNGGSGDNYGGGGAGGRIAINYTTDSSTITNSAYGASTGYQKGGAGTIFTKADSATNGDLIVDNGTVDGVDTCQTAGSNYIFDNITVKNYGKYVVPLGTSLTIADDFKTGTANASFTNNGTFFFVDLIITLLTFYQNGDLPTLTDLTIGSGATFEFQNLSATTSFILTNLTIKDGGTLTHQANGTTQVDMLNLIVTNNLDIQTGGSINLNAKGYAGGTNIAGQGPGGGGYLSQHVGGGAGYGGDGGQGRDNSYYASGGSAYGSMTQPINLGSGGGGGGSTSYKGGSGGGALKLNVSGTLTVTGSITANGGNGSGYGNSYLGGGGSGGGIYINTATLAGTGLIIANGGNGYYYNSSYQGGGGAGGRIAIYNSDCGDFSGSQTATEGTGYEAGGTGVITYDCTAPISTITSICNISGNGCSVTGVLASPEQSYNVATLEGTAEDTDSQLEQLKISIKDTDVSVNKWYDPVTNAFDQVSEYWFDPSITPSLPTSSQVAWSYDTSSIIWTINHTYQIRSRAHNPSSMPQDPPTSLNFSFVNSAPVISNVSVSQDSVGAVNVAYDIADNEQTQTTIYLLYKTETTLNESLASDDTTVITVADASFLPNSGTLILDNEIITYTSKSGNDLTGTINRGVNSTIASSHNSGITAWIKASDVSGDTGTVTNGTGKSIVWTAKTDLDGFYIASTTITVFSNDGASANMVGSGESAGFVLDAKDPIIGSPTGISIDARLYVNSGDLVDLALSCTDDTALDMKISLNSDLTGDSWQTYNAISSIAISTATTSAYVQFKDAKGNVSAILKATPPEIPNILMIQDVSNMTASPVEYGLFIGWKVISVSEFGFKQYNVYRSLSYVHLNSTAEGYIGQNYYRDNSVDFDTIYTYKLSSQDNHNNISAYSTISPEGKANGTQDAGEGGGGEETTPPTISNITTTEIGTTYITISWDTDELSNSTVGYSITQGSFAQTQGISTMTIAHTITVANLTPNTLYYFQVQSADPVGNIGKDPLDGENGYTVTTLQGPVISNVITEQVTNNTAKITWDTDQAATSYVVYSTNSDMSDSSSYGSETLVEEHSVTVQNLTQGIKYYYYIQSASNGVTAYDKNVVKGTIQYYNFTTTQDTASPVLSNISASSDTTSANIIWTTDELADSKVEYGETASYGNTATSSTLTINHIINIASLSNSTTYHYRVISSDANGNTSTSTDYTFITKTSADSVAPVIFNTATSSITLSSVIVTWTTNESSNSFVDYGISTSSFNLLAGNIDDATSTHSVILTGLSSNTTYYFQVRSQDVAGNTGTDNNGGDYYSFTTIQDTTFPVITSVLASPVYDTVAVITWTTDESADSKVEYGTVSGSYDDSLEDATLNLDHSTTLTNLTADTTYYYRVVSADVADNSTVSVEYNFTTLETLSEESDVQDREDAAGAEGVASVDTNSSGGGGVLIIDKTDKVEPVISDIKISDIRSDSVKVNWITDENSSSFVKYGKNKNNYDNYFGKNNLKITHIAKLKNLLSNTKYYYQISSVDSWGNLANSVNKSFTTLSLTEEIEQKTKEELTFKEIESLTEKEKEEYKEKQKEKKEEKKETAEGLFKIAANAVKKAMNIIRQSTSKLSIGTLESTLTLHQSSIEELAKSIPAPLMSGEPRVITTTKTAAIAWRTDKKANSLIAISPENQYNKDNKNSYQQVVGNPTAKVVEHAVTIYDLEPDSIYHYQLRNKGAVGPMAQSRDFTFRTEKEILEISNYTIQNISNEEATFKWVTNVEANSTIKYIPYRNNILSVDEAKIKNNKSITTIHEISINDFEAGVIYEVELISQDISDNTANEKLTAFSTAKDDMPPIISQTQTASALSPGKNTKVQTIISWKTNEPSTTRVYYQKGVIGKDQELSEITKLDKNYTKKHVVVITKFDSGTAYSFKVESIDSGGNVSLSKIHAILTPRQKESVFQVIMSNMEDIFGWVGKMR